MTAWESLDGKHEAASPNPNRRMKDHGGVRPCAWVRWYYRRYELPSRFVLAVSPGPSFLQYVLEMLSAVDLPSWIAYCGTNILIWDGSCDFEGVVTSQDPHQWVLEGPPSYAAKKRES